MSKPPFKRLITEDELERGSDREGLITLDYNNWQPELTKPQLSQIFENGSSLKIFLRPSNKIQSRQGSGTYIETYELPNIRHQDGKYLAFTDGNHTSSNNVKRLFQGYDSYYAYGNIGPGYYNYTVLCTETGIQTTTHVMNKVRYEEMKWIVVDDYQLIFEGTHFTDNVNIINAIQNYKSFRISLTLQDDTVIRQDLDLFFYYPDQRNLFGYTKASHFPAFFRDLAAFDQFCLQTFAVEYFYPQEMNVSLEDTGQPSFFNFYHDGTYEDAYMKIKGEKANYKNIKIFASK
ncbi:hypothetical protein [Curvivirga aplysinae]|uniref:hypothetical protein n=1 Tax=Curvivirga aplysinae TaxID=2529852 RepID=UPI0012BC1B4F|nr:hypothetical protein [Curvivirga aplysinae]MTI08290.1 hypothetical protein [Curvivirga aplysinae]